MVNKNLFHSNITESKAFVRDTTYFDYNESDADNFFPLRGNADITFWDSIGFEENNVKVLRYEYNIDKVIIDDSRFISTPIEKKFLNPNRVLPYRINKQYTEKSGEYDNAFAVLEFALRKTGN